ncbi:hypothetical protein [Devosia sp. CAU 1758]
MSTLVEVKRWARPFLGRHPELSMIGRNIVLSPIEHFVRGIFVDRTSMRRVTRVYCYVDPLLEMHAVPAFSWEWVLDLPFIDSPEFLGAFDEALEDCLQMGLKTINSLEEFLEKTSRHSQRRFGPLPLPRYHGRYGRALAALGRLDEAEPLLARDLANDPIAQRAANPHLPERLFDIAPDAQERHSYHTSLLALVRARDRQGIGALLRACEKQQAGRWKVEHLWQPTPFPVEIA